MGGAIDIKMLVAVTVALALTAVRPATACAGEVFNGRIAFSSFRDDPAYATGDIFTINDDGSDLRRLTSNPADDAQSDWAPDGRDIVYRIRRPNSRVNFEIARMRADGADVRQLTDTPIGQASSQPSWLADRSAVLFRRSGANRLSSIWRMGTLGEAPALLHDPPGPQQYPTMSPDMSRIAFATTTSPAGDTDRAVQVMDASGSGLTTLFDVPGAFDSAPAWSPDGARIAFETNADVGGANPERDVEIWMMDADGRNATQLTHNALHDEGAAWSPDATMLAYSSGPDNAHVDINVMSSRGVHLRRLTDHAARDESPDWQTIPAPDTDRRCGDLATASATRDVRAAGRGLSCAKALELAARWSRSAAPRTGSGAVRGFDAQVEDFGGILRVVLTHRGNGAQRGNEKLVAFLHQP